MFPPARNNPSFPFLAAWVLSLAGWAVAPAWPDYPGWATPALAAQAADSEKAVDSAVLCERVVMAHNRIRADARLPALSVSPRLQAAAQAHARDMAKRGKMSHTGSDGSSPFDRIVAQGYKYRRAGENVAVGYFTTERLMKGWMDSPHHKKNILGSFSQIGVACATASDGKRYWCVTFGLPTRS
ncbi:MAG: CAP domain-containing protein [Isosphaeraceae bacterium]